MKILLRKLKILHGMLWKSVGTSFFIWRLFHKKSYHHLIKYKDIHAGKRCFIVGTGPSLCVEDVEKLQGEISFGVNTCLKLFDKINWRPDYYCIIDPDTFNNLKEEIKTYEVNNLFIADNRMHVEHDNIEKFPLDCSRFFWNMFPKLFPVTKFSNNIVKKIYDGCSVVYACLQIAAYMGFSEIYLLGVDCNYSDPDKLHSKMTDYVNYQYHWDQSTGEGMIQSFKVAFEYAERNNIKILNATRGGLLEVFPRVELDEIFKEA